MATRVIFTPSSCLLFFVTGVLVHLNKQASAQTTVDWSADQPDFDNTSFSQTVVQTVPGTLNPPKPSQKYKRTGLVISSNGTQFWRGIADAYHHLCSQSCRNRTTSPVSCSECFCDDVCFFFADCCPDLYADAGHGPVAHSKWSGLTCSRTSFGSTIPSRKEVLMVTTCLDNATDRTAVNNCLNSTSADRRFTQPVTETRTFLTYKNVFCAECNGAHDTIPWPIMSSSGNIRITSEVTSQSTVETKVTASQVDAVSYGRPPAYAKHQRWCRSNIVMVTRCNKSEFYGYFEPALERACASLVIPVWVSSVWYKNPFCVLCNSNLTWEELRRSLHSSRHPFSEHIPIQTLVEISPQCPENEFYDWQKVLKNNHESNRTGVLGRWED